VIFIVARGVWSDVKQTVKRCRGWSTTIGIVASLSVVVAIAGCGSSSSSAPTPVPGAAASVAYRNIAIAPDHLTVHVGQRVRWQNFDATPHNVTSAGGVQQFRSKDFGRGGTFMITADKVGVIHYVCTIHPASMVGTITVVQ